MYQSSRRSGAKDRPRAGEPIPKGESASPPPDWNAAAPRRVFVEQMHPMVGSLSGNRFVVPLSNAAASCIDMLAF